MTREEFKKVIKQCSFYDALVKNHKEGYQRSEEKWKTMDGLLNDAPIREWVNYAFTWCETKEGQDFWCNINNHWGSFVSYDDFDSISDWYKKGRVSLVSRNKVKKPTLNFRI